jgi:hypothetical protein
VGLGGGESREAVNLLGSDSNLTWIMWGEKDKARQEGQQLTLWSVLHRLENVFFSLLLRTKRVTLLLFLVTVVNVQTGEEGVDDGAGVCLLLAPYAATLPP